MGSRLRPAAPSGPQGQGTFLAKPVAEAPVYWSVIGHRLIGRSLPLLMATLLLAFG
jgi:hypothetical protein